MSCCDQYNWRTGENHHLQQAVQFLDGAVSEAGGGGIHRTFLTRQKLQAMSCLGREFDEFPLVGRASIAVAMALR